MHAGTGALDGPHVADHLQELGALRRKTAGLKQLVNPNCHSTKKENEHEK